MVFSFERPRARVSDNYYRPECRFIDKGFRKTFKEATAIKDGSVFERMARKREVRSMMRSTDHSVRTLQQKYRSSSLPPPVDRIERMERSMMETTKSVKAVADEVLHTPIWKKHPYRLAVEDEYVPPAEDSVWPANRPHFHLVSSYDLMLKYLGLDSLRQPYPGTGHYLVKSN